MWQIYLLIFCILFLYYKFKLNRFYSKVILTGKVVIVTGTNRVSYETALDLAKRGAKVILTSNDETKGAKLLRKIIKKSNNQSVAFEHTDFCSETSVKKFVEDFKNTKLKLDILVLNNEASSKDISDIPRHIANYYGQFLLVNLLEPILRKSAPSRVIITTSHLHKFGSIDNLNTDGYKSYFNSKLCNKLFCDQLSKRLDNYGVTVECATVGILHEIFNGTIFEKIFSMYSSQNIIRLAVSEDNFDYLEHCSGDTNELADKLWTLSEEIVMSK